MSLQNYGLQEREEKKSILLTKLLFGEVGGYLSLFFSGLVNENGCRRCIFLVQRPCPVEYIKCVVLGALT